MPHFVGHGPFARLRGGASWGSTRDKSGIIQRVALVSGCFRQHANLLLRCRGLCCASRHACRGAEWPPALNMQTTPALPERGAHSGRRRTWLRRFLMLSHSPATFCQVAIWNLWFVCWLNAPLRRSWSEGLTAAEGEPGYAVF